MPGRRPAQRPSWPPAGDNWPLPIILLPVDRSLFRLTRTAYPNPAYFGASGAYRFDAPDGSFGVCYLGTTLACCFLEVFEPLRDPHGRRLFVERQQLRGYYAAVAQPLRTLRLAYLADDGLAQLGMDQRVTGGDDYDLSQAWSAAVYGHHADVDGIFYTSRHHNQFYSVAVFERSRAALHFRRWGGLADETDADLWSQTAAVFHRFDFGVG